MKLHSTKKQLATVGYEDTINGGRIFEFGGYAVAVEQVGDKFRAVAFSLGRSAKSMHSSEIFSMQADAIHSLREAWVGRPIKR